MRFGTSLYPGGGRKLRVAVRRRKQGACFVATKASRYKISSGEFSKESVAGGTCSANMQHRETTLISRTEGDDYTEQCPKNEPSLIPDCLEHVFKYLNTPDKGRAAQVCRLWKDTCYRRGVWKGTVAKLRLPRTSEEALHSVRARGIKKVRVKEHKNDLESITRILQQSLHSLDFGGCHYTTDEALAKAFATVMPELKELNLAYCGSITDLGLSKSLDKCPNLESLSLKGCVSIHLCESTKTSMKKCKRMKMLNLGGCKLISMRSFQGLFEEEGVNQIKDLNLSDCDRVCDSCLQYICTHLKCLEVLNLSYCISLTDETLLYISQELTNLKILSLQSVDKPVSSDGLRRIANSCVALKSLDIAFCDWVDDECLEKIAQGRLSDSLEELNISCARITDHGIWVISHSLQRLKHLKIGQCYNLTDKSLALIGNHLLSLVTIDIYGCGFSCRAVNSIWDTLPDLWLVNNFMISNFGER